MCPSINPHFLPFGDHSSYVRLYMFAIASVCVCIIVERTSAKKIIGGESERVREGESRQRDQKYRRGRICL